MRGWGGGVYDKELWGIESPLFLDIAAGTSGTIFPDYGAFWHYVLFFETGRATPLHCAHSNECLPLDLHQIQHFLLFLEHLGPVIQTITGVEDLTACCQHCWENRRCQAYNYGYGTGSDTCKLVREQTQSLGQLSGSSPQFALSGASGITSGILRTRTRKGKLVVCVVNM